MRAALSSVKSRIRKGIKYHESRRREQCKAIGTYNRYKLYVYIGVYIYIYKRYKLKFPGVRALVRADGSSKFQRFLRSCTVS